MSIVQEPGKTPSLWRRIALGHSGLILLACLLMVILAAPSVPFMLPSFYSHLSEEYQPLQTFKFFYERGQAFEKYPPLPNFILAPGYALTLTYWYLDGTFADPAKEFPFGFKHPITQVGFLHLEGRVIFLALALLALYAFGRNLKLVTANTYASFLAFFFCLASNYIVVLCLPIPNPNSPMLAFSAAALLVYLRIVYLGLTGWRAFWLSFWAVCAISSKELAAPMFVLPYLGLGLVHWRKPGFAKCALIALASGIGFYALVNVFYAPGTWAQRMEFWLAGQGADSAVWGGGGVIKQAQEAIAAVLDNLGPGGVVVVAISLIGLLFCRPRHWLLLLLPCLSILILGLLPMGYAQDRFYILFALSLTPTVAAGLAGVADRLRGFAMRLAVWTVVGVAMMVNLVFATFTWHCLAGKADAVIEQHVLRNLPRGTHLYRLLSGFNFPTHPGASRLAGLGYDDDPRSIQQIAADKQHRPDWIYALNGTVRYINDAARFPKRAAMFKAESSFDFSQWGGIEALGYRQVKTLRPGLPPWFVFRWMPAVGNWELLNTVLIYQRRESGSD